MRACVLVKANPSGHSGLLLLMSMLALEVENWEVLLQLAANCIEQLGQL